MCGVEGIAGALTWRGLGPEGWTYCVSSRHEGRDLLRVQGGGCIWCFVADADVGSDSGTGSDSDVTAVAAFVVPSSYEHGWWRPSMCAGDRGGPRGGQLVGWEPASLAGNGPNGDGLTGGGPCSHLTQKGGGHIQPHGTSYGFNRHVMAPHGCLLPTDPRTWARPMGWTYSHHKAFIM